MHDVTTRQAMIAAKADLRRQVTAKIKALTPEAVKDQSRQVVQRVFELPEYQQARRVSIYLSMPGTEVQTNAIVEHALDSGKSVFVPYIEKSVQDMRMFGLKDRTDLESLQRDRWGIPSLAKDSLSSRAEAQSDVDVVFMPAVAFNKGSLNRLGHGKGYYDRFISAFAARNEGRRPLLGLNPREPLKQ